MLGNASIRETELIEKAVGWLADRLPEAWAVERANRQVAAGGGTQRVDAAIDLKASNGTYTTFAVEARESFTPRDAEQLRSNLIRVLRQLGGQTPVLVIAPWLSRRTQELLEAARVNFIDLTGNALIRLDNPAVFIKSTGNLANPEPASRGKERIAGLKAARLIRLLADVRPPYGVRELATAAELSPGYVSRLLEALDVDALVERSRRGRVESVDVPGLIRRWAESYDVLRTNRVSMFLAPNGPAAALAGLPRLPERVAPCVVTGSFAAARLAPVAAPALLLVYCSGPGRLADELRLLPAEAAAANVAVMQPFDPVVWKRTGQDGRVRYAAPAQVAVDCLTGTGRMPAEGEAVMSWMEANESTWRLPSLADVDREEGA